MDSENRNCVNNRLRSSRGLTAGQLDHRCEQARNHNNGEQKLLKTKLGLLESKEKKSVKLLRRTTEDLKKTLHELNMAAHSVKVWMDLEERSSAAAESGNAINIRGSSHHGPFASVDGNGGNANEAGFSEYSRYRLPRISSAVAGCRRNIANGSGPRRYSENDVDLASKLLQLRLKNGEAESITPETESESAEKSSSFRNLTTLARSPRGLDVPGKHSWVGSVYKTDSPRDSPYGSPRDSPRGSPKLLHRSSEHLHRSASIESLGMSSLSNASLGDISVDVSPFPPDAHPKMFCPSTHSAKSSANSLASVELNCRSSADRPDTPTYPQRPPLSPRIPNIRITQSGRMQPVFELADIDPLVPAAPLGLPPSPPCWPPSASSPASEWRAEKPLREARRKMLLNLPATFAALSRRRHSSPESQDEAVKICRERFSEMLDRRRDSEQSELQAKVKEFLEKTMSSSSSDSSSEPAIDG